MKLLDKVLGRVAPELLSAESGFSRDDRKAITREFAAADAIEPGLGAELARFVIVGDNESVLLRLDPILAQRDEAAERLRLCLFVPQHAQYGEKTTFEELKKLLATRRRILVELDGFDPAGMRRLGILHAKASRWMYGHGTERSPAWLRALSQASEAARQRHHEELPPFLDAPRIRAMLAVEGLSAAPLVDILFSGGRWGTPPEEKMAGVVDVLAAEPEAVCDEMLHLPASNRGIFINYLAANGLLDRVPAYFERIFAAGGANAKATREPALGALAKCDPERVERRALAALDSPAVEERLAGVHALAAARGAEAAPRLEQHLQAERSKKVVQAIEALRPRLTLAEAAESATRDDGPDGYTAVDGSFVTPPPSNPSADEVPADTADVLRRLMADATTTSRIEWDDIADKHPTWVKNRGPYQVPHDPGTVPKLVAIMKGMAAEVDARVLGRSINASLWNTPKTRAAFDAGLKALFARPDFGIPALARLLVAGRPSWGHEMANLMRGAQSYGAAYGIELSRRIRAGADFRQIAALVEAAGLGAAEGLPEMVDRLRWADRDGEPANPTVWPVIAAHLAVVDRVIADKSAVRRADGHVQVIGLCSLFPKPPRRYLATLLDAAAQGSRPDRRAARALLAGAGSLTPVIAPLLKDAAASKRAGAAQWMGERKDPSAVPHLRDALGAEQSLEAKAAILAALAACGDDISDQFSEERLAAEAQRELRKLKVDHSAIIDRTALPRLRWADGRAVDPAVVQYWFARAHKLKLPGGDPLLVMALERLNRDDAAAMGRTVLSTFIALDTRKPTADEANAYAESNADGRVKALSWRKDYTREQAFAELRQLRLAEYCGSALDHRGLLALARFVPPGEAVAAVERYLKDHGKRANQCRALLDMLAGDPVPQKLQLLLATARRHKQPGARKYAGDLAAAIAAERGWSAAELADRTVPTLDLDANGTRPLPIGCRVFRLRLAGDEAEGLTLAILNPDGKAVAALPQPKDPAEADEAKAAKKVVAEARKELKQTAALQTARLHEAMCVGKLWDAADFAASFLAHPILGRLLRRLVLSGHDAAGAVVATMRPLDDGTLSDAEDAPVSLDRPDATGIAQIGIAHRATLGEDAAARWRDHLADYDVKPLFAQFDRPLQPLPADGASAIADRRGYAIDAFALRNAANKRGYVPGGIMDASYSAYERIFSDLGLAASIAFSGDFVGDRTTHTAALHELRFVRVRNGKPSEWGAEGIPLAKVPPILLQEAWADYHAIAAAGSGFDPNWEKLGY